MKDFNKNIKFREWDEYSLSDDAEFDKYNLDIDAENQATLMCKWLELLAQAQAELSVAKEKLQNKEAKLLLKVKAEGTPDIEKPTDSVAKAWVYTQPEYRKAQRRKRKAENDVAYLHNARSVLEHKKVMIKTAADLWITGYFARPNIHGEVKGQLDESRRKEHGKKLSKSLERRHLRDKE